MLTPSEFQTEENQSLMTVFDRQLTKLSRHNGLRYALNYLKISRSIIYRHLGGDPVSSTEGIKVTSDGIPTFLEGWIPHLRNRSKVHSQVVLSLLSIGRLFSSVNELKTDSIEVVNNPDTYLAISDKDIDDFLDYYGFRNLEVPGAPVFEIRSSVGPCGPAMSSIIEEAHAIPEELVTALEDLAGDSTVIEVLKRIRSEKITTPESLKPSIKSSSCFRRVTVVEDKEFKSRVIAIFDYWSQSVLRPYHQLISSMIKSIQNDCTYGQMKGVASFKKMNGPFFSHDLSSATDLLPVELQVRIMAKIFNENIANR
jgi:hypothetical protein